MRSRKSGPRTASETQKTLRFVVTEAEEEMIRLRAKEMNMSLVEYLRFVAIPKD
jgi:hypothetical protein